MEGLSPPFDQQVTLSPKHLIPHLGQGVVSAFWSASDNKSKGPNSQLWMEGLSLPFDQQVTLSPKNLVPNFGWMN